MINFKEYIALCSKYLTTEPRGKEGRFYKDHIYICDFTVYYTIVAWLDVYISKTDNTIETSLEGKEYTSIKDFKKDFNIFVEKYKISDDDFKELLEVCNTETVNTPPPWSAMYSKNVRDLNGGVVYENTEKVPWWVAHPEYNKIDCCATNNVESKNE